MGLSETLKDWFGTFWQILILPTPKTFVDESEKANKKFGSAVSWVIFIILYSYLISAIAGYVLDFTLFIIGALIFPLVIILASSASHFVLQRFFHRKQYLYDKILYIYTAIFVLFQFIINPIIFFSPPTVSIFNYILIAYQFILLIIATKAIAKVKYWQATITVITALIIGVIIFICVYPFIISLMGGVNRTMR
jgi:hypothetical protein